VASLLSNLHLLLRVPSFSRWPLEIRFFSEDVHKTWLDWSQATAEALRPSIPIIQDFPPPSADAPEGSGSPQAKKRKIGHGIAALEIGYADQKSHVQKGKEVVEFENEGSCTLCKKDLEHNAGFYTICPSDGCESVTHLTCLGKHFVEDEGSVVPIQGNCPGCKAELRWVDVVKEVTLRLRGQKEVENLLKVKRARKGVTASQAGVEAFDDDPSDEEIQNGIAAELERLQEFDPTGATMGTGDWHDMDDSDDSNTGSIASTTSRTQKAISNGTKIGALRTVIEDSDWEDALVVD
jgi:structure-specific endonuclease subunit SLX1